MRSFASSTPSFKELCGGTVSFTADIGGFAIYNIESKGSGFRLRATGDAVKTAVDSAAAHLKTSQGPRHEAEDSYRRREEDINSNSTAALSAPDRLPLPYQPCRDAAA